MKFTCTHKFGIAHLETGLTLRQYAKKFPVNVRSSCPLADATGCRLLDCKDEKLTYVQFETGSLGFYYSCGYDGDAIYCLGPGWTIVPRPVMPQLDMVEASRAIVELRDALERFLEPRPTYQELFPPIPIDMSQTPPDCLPPMRLDDNPPGKDSNAQAGHQAL